ncbi:hypothetical protein BD626DRAFT_179191 [Schizophyllum amplum]|uniref:Uncharacterized protein n=1 Tax=Schizophyllum amplum TaxID=97359 RepID=A0A550C1U6_9AGAR|nr:hypothetical protein BD626DRAFT_179191 [Auriculariopsis ampla]
MPAVFFSDVPSRRFCIGQYLTAPYLRADPAMKSSLAPTPSARRPRGMWTRHSGRVLTRLTGSFNAALQIGPRTPSCKICSAVPDTAVVRMLANPVLAETDASDSENASKCMTSYPKLRRPDPGVALRRRHPLHPGCTLPGFLGSSFYSMLQLGYSEWQYIGGYLATMYWYSCSYVARRYVQWEFRGSGDRTTSERNASAAFRRSSRTSCRQRAIGAIEDVVLPLLSAADDMIKPQSE